MAEHLARELASLRQGDHLCLPYESTDECDEVIAPFVGDGLARGERCVYILAQDQQEALMAMLASAGVNAGRARDRGALWLLTPEETYFRSGQFDPDDTLALADELVARALADGYTGLRASGEIGPAPAHAVPWATVFAYEARFNEHFARRPVVALCRYRRPTASPAMVADALKTHPTAIVGGRVCRNPYYEKTDIAMAGDRDAVRVEWMLSQLRRTSASEVRAREMTRSLADETARLSAENQSRAQIEVELERAVRVRDRFLDVLTEELAGPIGGLAVEIQALALANGEARAEPSAKGRSARITALGQHLTRLGAVVEELKEVSRLTNRAAAVWDDVDLADVARQVTLRNRERLAAGGSAVTFQTEPRIQGRWDRRRIEQLIANLLLNAGKHGAGHPIDLDVATDAGMAILSVRYRGGGRLADTNDSGFDAGSSDFPGARGGRARAPGRYADAGLWVSREIASSFGGTLRVVQQAPPDDGPTDPITTTIMTVELPRGGPRPKPVC